MRSYNDNKKNEGEFSLTKSLVYNWRARTLYTGPPHFRRNRQYFAHSLIIGFRGPFQIRDLDSIEIRRTRMALVPMAVSFFMDLEDKNFSIVYLDHYGFDFKRLKSLAGSRSGNIYHDFDDEWVEEICNAIEYIHQNKVCINEAGDLWDILGLNRCSEKYDRVEPLEGIDPRLCKVIDMYIDGQLSLNCHAEDVAKAVNLSQSRLNKLFRQYIDSNFRTFRTHLQFHCYLIAKGFGKTQSEAALEAGFVDQAHSCNRFKQSSGMRASDYFSKSTDRTYFFDPELSKRYLNNDALFGALTEC